MKNLDVLIEKFKEFKEELNKNVNMSYSGGSNSSTGMPSTMGTSGGQGGMYRAEAVDKNVAPPMTMQMSDVEKAGPGGQDNMAMSRHESMSVAKNGQWSLASDGTNREANPKLRSSDFSSGGKRHMIKQEGTNEEANPTQPHNKAKFKVVPMISEKESKKADAKGLPYDGKDKDVHKGEKQGNDARGFDENKAPGRGTLGV